MRRKVTLAACEEGLAVADARACAGSAGVTPGPSNTSKPVAASHRFIATITPARSVLRLQAFPVARAPPRVTVQSPQASTPPGGARFPPRARQISRGTVRSANDITPQLERRRRLLVLEFPL